MQYIDFLKEIALQAIQEQNNLIQTKDHAKFIIRCENDDCEYKTVYSVNEYREVIRRVT